MFQINGLYCQTDTFASQIQGKWKIVEVKLFFTDRINKDSLTPKERNTEDLYKEWNIGKIVRVNRERFYFFKKDQGCDTLNYIIKGDTLLFTDKKVEWFYKNISSSVMHDFFSRQGNSYNRAWKEGGFVW